MSENLVAVVLDGVYLLGLSDQMREMGMRFELVSPPTARRLLKDLKVYRLSRPHVPPESPQSRLL